MALEMNFEEAPQLYKKKIADKNSTADEEKSYRITPDEESSFWTLKDIHDNSLAIVHATGQVVLTKKTGENNE